MSDTQFDLVIVGAGPGGYTGAIRAAQLGLKTAVIEKDATLGGTCLNVGCIPSKALLESSEHFSMAQHGFSDHGIKVGKLELDLDSMMARKSKIVKDLTGGIEYLFKKNNIVSFKGKGRLTSPNSIEVTAADGSKQEVHAQNIMLATGSVPNALPTLPFDEKTIFSSTEALSLPKVPKTLAVIGGGVIGLELGSVWMRLGAEVTVIEYADMICATMDQQIMKRMLQVMKKQGMKFIMGAKVTGATVNKDGATIQYEVLKDGKKETLQAEKVLVSTGRRAFSDGLGLEELGIEKDNRGVVVVNEHFQTKYPNIFAVGDLIRGPMLAHKAEEEGVAVAEIIATGHGHVNYNTVPSVIYTWPEVASVGQTEEQVKASGVEYKVGTFPFTPNGRAKAIGMTDGMVKIIADAKSDLVLGIHILGPRASDMIAEAVVAMEFSASAEDIARSFHAHPTLSEVMREAALAVDGRARQM